MKCSKTSFQIAVRRVYSSFINFMNIFCISFAFWFLSPKCNLECWKYHCNYTKKPGPWIWGSGWGGIEFGTDIWGSRPLLHMVWWLQSHPHITKASHNDHCVHDPIINLSRSNTTRHKCGRGKGRAERDTWLGNLNLAIFVET